VYPYQSLKPLEYFEMCSKQPEVVADINKSVTKTIREGECSDEIGYVKEIIQMTTEEWKCNSKLHLGLKKKW
jgi:hypothetical protein